MRWDQIEGWFSPADAQFVSRICKGINGGIVVELGFFAGRSTAVMAPICKANQNAYFAIDNCKGACKRDPATKAQQSRDMKKMFETNMRTMNLLSSIKVHTMDSSASAQLFDDEEVDFCFVDASHVAADVKKDIEAWWPKIKQGGVLGGHDYTWGSVKGVVNEFVNIHGLDLISEGNCWKIIKKNVTND